MSHRRSISILGATGSIGKSTLKLIASHPERFQVEALVAQSNVALLAEQAIATKAAIAVIAEEAHYAELKSALAGTGIEAACGAAAIEAAMARKADCVVSAIVGAAGLKPTLAAIKAGSTIALANKECLVCAGELLMQEAARYGATLLPVDSEHNALFQIFETKAPQAIANITLTASGGPFLHTHNLTAITPEQAVKHPNWSMGAKISVDSATMMNKGLEVIEAFHLFPVAIEQIEVVIHPESVIHGLVHYIDGSVLACMSQPDMITPIAYAIAYPERIAAPVAKLDLAAMGKLTFLPVDHKKFPALSLAYAALKAGGNAPATLNAANEIAVQAFLEKRIRFLDIAELVAEILATAAPHAVSCLDDVFAADAAARRAMQNLIGKKNGMAA